MDYAKWGGKEGGEQVIAYLQDFNVAERRTSEAKPALMERLLEEGLRRPVTSGIGHRLLCDMGWAPGEPLKNGGLVEPLSIHRLEKQRGLGFQAR